MERIRYLLGWLCLELSSACSGRALALDDEVEGTPLEADGRADANPGASYRFDGALVRARWDCEVREPAPLANTGPGPETIDYLVSVLGSESGGVPHDLSVLACRSDDAECNAPAPSSVTPPDVEGATSLRVTLPAGFDGYLRLDAPGYVRTEHYFGGPLSAAIDGAASVRGDPIRLYTDDEWQAWFDDLGVARQPDTGAVFVRAIDCGGRPSEGIRVSLSAVGDQWVMRNGARVQDEQRALPTDSSGLSGFLNVSPVTTRTEAWIKTCSTDGTCEDTPWALAAILWTTHVRANTITRVEVRRDTSYGH
jgi:hypothetical protein